MRFLSLFDGIGAATVAWTPLGWECVGVSEIEPFPIAVTKHHYPDVPHLGDVTKITEEQIAALGRIDLVVGGFPCQDLSVAGKRAGLRNTDGTTTRSGLFYDAMRVVQWARQHGGARWLVIENVPGLFSSAKGLDFAAVVGAMVGTEFDVPRDGWRNAGVAAGPEGLCEWATLDAQFFGLAQRRKRVFLVADFGDWTGRPPVLLERESLQWNPAPRREAGKGIAAGALRSTDGGSDVDHARAHHLITMAHGQGGAEIAHDMGPTLTCNHEAPILAHALRGEGFDASEDGTGLGTPLLPVAFDTYNQTVTGDTTQTLCSRGDTPGGNAHLVPAVFAASEDGTGRGTPLVPVHAFDARQSNVIQYGDMPGPLDTCGNSIAVAFVQNQRDEVRTMEVAGALAAEPGAKQQTYVAFQSSQSGVRIDEVHATLDSNNGSRRHNGVLAFSGKDYVADAGEIAPTLRSMGHDGSHANGGGQVSVAYTTKLHNTTSNQSGKVYEEYSVGLDCNSPPPALLTAMAVRRLTPRECERLQGFPDDYTVPWRTRKTTADGPRYKALGNSMAVPCMRWIGERIELVESVARELEGGA